MSDNTLNKSVKQHYVERFGDGLAKDADIPTFHGFRATFKTWVEEGDIPFSDRVVEAMQGHKVEISKVRAAYNRAKYVEQRQRLSQLWCDFLAGDT
jgi:integrase